MDSFTHHSASPQALAQDLQRLSLHADGKNTGIAKTTQQSSYAPTTPICHNADMPDSLSVSLETSSSADGSIDRGVIIKADYNIQTPSACDGMNSNPPSHQNPPLSPHTSDSDSIQASFNTPESSNGSSPRDNKPVDTGMEAGKAQDSIHSMLSYHLEAGVVDNTNQATAIPAAVPYQQPRRSSDELRQPSPPTPPDQTRTPSPTSKISTTSNTSRFFPVPDKHTDTTTISPPQNTTATGSRNVPTSGLSSAENSGFSLQDLVATSQAETPGRGEGSGNSVGSLGPPAFPVRQSGLDHQPGTGTSAVQPRKYGDFNLCIAPTGEVLNFQQGFLANYFAQTAATTTRPSFPQLPNPIPSANFLDTQNHTAYKAPQGTHGPGLQGPSAIRPCLAHGHSSIWDPHLGTSAQKTPTQPTFTHTTNIQSLEQSVENTKAQKNLSTTRPVPSWVTKLPSWRVNNADQDGNQQSEQTTQKPVRDWITGPKPAPFVPFRAPTAPSGNENKAANEGADRTTRRAFRPMHSKLDPDASHRPLTEEEIAYRMSHGISLRYQGQSHNPKNISVDIDDSMNCALFLTRLPPKVTYRDLLTAVAQHRPGRIWSTYINPPEVANPEKVPAKPAQNLHQRAMLNALKGNGNGNGNGNGHGNNNHNHNPTTGVTRIGGMTTPAAPGPNPGGIVPFNQRTCAAKLIFYHPSEAQRLMAIAGQPQGFLVGGQRVHVMFNRHRTAAQRYENPTSRVLIISGPREIVDEAWLRDLFDQYFEYQTEEVIRIAEDNAWRAIEWRFGSMRAQAHAAYQLLRSHYPGVVAVKWGIDPCAGYLEMSQPVAGAK